MQAPMAGGALPGRLLAATAAPAKPSSCKQGTGVEQSSPCTPARDAARDAGLEAVDDTVFGEARSSKTSTQDGRLVPVEKYGHAPRADLVLPRAAVPRSRVPWRFEDPAGVDEFARIGSSARAVCLLPGIAASKSASSGTDAAHLCVFRARACDLGRIGGSKGLDERGLSTRPAQPEAGTCPSSSHLNAFS